MPSGHDRKVQERRDYFCPRLNLQARYTGLKKSLALLVLLLLGVVSPLTARSWDDLNEGETEIYGREREEKLPLRLFFVQREKWQDHDALHILWLYGYKDYPRYSSRRLLPFYYRLESRVDNRRLTFTPISLTETDGESESSIWFWLFFRGEDRAAKKSYSALFPFYYRESLADASSVYWLTPLFWYSRTKAPLGDGYSFGAPVIPLVMLNREATYSDLTVFYIFRQRSGQQTLSYLLPLWYYHSQPQGYLVSVLPPIAWYERSGNSSWLLVFPLWYSSHHPGGSTVASPLYLRSESADSRLNAFIPLWFSYSRKNYHLHINAAGISLAEEQFSALPFSATVAGNRLYADWDFGWFYSLFHVSSRSSIALADTATEENKIPIANTGITERRRRNRADSESFFGLYALFGALAYERADHYRHFRLLPLSWLTWDSRSDTGVQTVIPFYVHYRDAESRYLVIAPLLVPFYASQETTQSRLPEDNQELPAISAPATAAAPATGKCRSDKQAWLMIMFIREYDCSLEEREQTLLWPVLNRYTSPQRGGFRVFPVFWSKWRQTTVGEERWNFSPLHYSRSLNDNYRLLTWLFYYLRNETATSYGTWGIWHIGRTPVTSTTYFFPVWLRTAQEPGDRATGRAGYHDSLLTVAGLWWRSSSTMGSAPARTVHVSPLYLYFASGSGTDFYSWLYYRTDHPSISRHGIPLLFNHTSRGDTYRNFYLFPFYRSVELLSNDETEYTSWLLPLWYSRSDGKSAERFIAGYWYERRPGFALDNFLLMAGRSDDDASGRHSRHALLYTFRYDYTPTESRLNLLYGLLFSREQTEWEFSWHFALITGYRITPDGVYRRHHLLPAYWYSVSDDERMLLLPALLSVFTTSNDGTRQFQAVLLGLLWYNSNHETEYRQTEAIGAGTIWFHNRTPERRFDSYGSLYGLLWHYETETNYKRLAVLTFLYIRTETENGVRHRLLGIPL
ncbi:MAG TPA: hypothetical protein PKI36_02710 [Turneriella sp.]|nr:hypothetical protein [Turneriella sp.]